MDASIVGVLSVLVAGLIPPRVQAARGDADRLKCHDNLRKIGVAFSYSAKANGGLPPRRTGLNNGEPFGSAGSSDGAPVGEYAVTFTWPEPTKNPDEGALRVDHWRNKYNDPAKSKWKVTIK